MVFSTIIHEVGGFDVVVLYVSFLGKRMNEFVSYAFLYQFPGLGAHSIFKFTIISYYRCSAPQPKTHGTLFLDYSCNNYYCRYRSASTVVQVSCSVLLCNEILSTNCDEGQAQVRRSQFSLYNTIMAKI